MKTETLDQQEVDLDWNKTFSHFYNLDESDISLCGGKRWTGKKLTLTPTKPKCPICDALRLQPPQGMK